MKLSQIASLAIVIILSLFLWAQGLFFSSANPFLVNVFRLVISLVIIILLTTLVTKTIVHRYINKSSYDTAHLFTIAFIALLIGSGLGGFLFGNSETDIQLHDTYFVVANAQILILLSFISGIYACIYRWFPKISGRQLNEKLGKVHFWLTTIGVFLIIFPLKYIGMVGVPRRYYSFEYKDTFDYYAFNNKLITIIAISVFLVQFLLAINMVVSFIRKS